VATVRRSPEVLAVIFDFDDTLADDTTTALLTAHGLDPSAFWQSAQQLVEGGYDQSLAYLRLLLENVGPGRPLGNLSNSDLNERGKLLDDLYYPGLKELLEDLRRTVSERRDIGLEFYIISGGLQAIMAGSRFVKDNFTGVYGCQLDEDENGVVRYIKRCVTFTEKTRYLFEIHKGIAPTESARNPYLVNRAVAHDDRRIPFENIIYIGDGLTDIPCFSLVLNNGGLAFGVFKPDQPKSAKTAYLELLRPARVISMNAPKYGATDELGSLLRTALAQRCAAIELGRRVAE
jgi:phosphoserine phosphatase